MFLKKDKSCLLLLHSANYFYQNQHLPLPTCSLVCFDPYLYIFAKDCYYGAQTTIYLAVENDRNLVSGEYYRDLKIFPSSKLALSDENNTKLWEKTKEKYQDFLLINVLWQLDLITT